MNSKNLNLLLIVVGFVFSIFSSAMLKIAPIKSDYLVVWSYIEQRRGEIPYIDFEIEYPVLIGLIITIFARLSDSYGEFFSWNSLLALVTGLFSTVLLYFMLEEKRLQQIRSLVIFWIFAPTMLMYGVYNWDLFGILFMMVSIYLFMRHRFTISSIALAIGICIKLLPVLLLPIYLLKTKSNLKRIKIVFITSATWLLINLPFMLGNFEGWIHTYTWQIFTRPPNPDSLGGLIITAFGGGYAGFYEVLNREFANTVSIVIFTFLTISYFTILIVKRKEDVLKLGFFALLIFLLFTKIYSPQFNLWLLPFLPFIGPTLIIFYIFDISSFLIMAAHTPWYMFSPQYSLHIYTLLITRHICGFALLLTQLWRRDSSMSQSLR